VMRVPHLMFAVCPQSRRSSEKVGRIDDRRGGGFQPKGK